MAFLSPDLAEGVLLTGETVSDGTKNTEANLNDNDTGTQASNEIRQGMSGYKITHDLGFAVANLATLSIRVFDGDMMQADKMVVYPYSSGDTAVVTGNEVTLQIVDNGAYDTINCDAMVGDFGDVGTDQISIRFVSDDAENLRGRFNEIQIDFTESAGGLSIPIAAYHHFHHNMDIG